MVAHGVRDAVASQVPCPRCGRARRHKDTREIVGHSLLGMLRLPSPRWWHCDSHAPPSGTFQPLAEGLLGRTTPELAYLQARFAGVVSYGITAKLLGELLPWAGRGIRPWCAELPRPLPPGWKTSSVMSGSASSTLAKKTWRNSRART